MPGRPPKPTHPKSIKGTMQPCRTSAREPKLPREIPSPPAHLSDRAKSAWGYVSALLDEMGALTRVDGLAIEGLCEAYAELCAAREALRERGSTTYETLNQSGSVMHRAYPEVGMAADADRRVSGWLAKFGLSPADRSRVSAALDRTANPFADL